MLLTAEISDNFVSTEHKSPSIPSKSIYEVVLPVILPYLSEPRNLKSLASLPSVNVSQSQLRKWLDRAVTEGKVKKNKKPVTYEIDRPTNLLSLLEP